VKATQEMLDAVAPGDKKVWEHFLAQEAIYTDENGKTYTKKEFLDELKPLPPIAKGTYVNSTHYPYTFLCEGCLLIDGTTFATNTTGTARLSTGPADTAWACFGTVESPDLSAAQLSYPDSSAMISCASLSGNFSASASGSVKFR